MFLGNLNQVDSHRKTESILPNVVTFITQDFSIE